MDDEAPQDRWADRAGATRADALGLVVLVTAGLVVLVVLWWWQRPQPVVEPAPVGVVGMPVGGTIVVHVTGAVANPGVVTTTDGARVVDVLQLAGGATSEADLGALNLARLVIDGEQVVVRSVGEDGAGSAASASAWDADGRLDLNQATASELQELPGVGPVLAGRIVAHREANGPFAQVGDLRAVAGIGEKTFQTLAALIRV